MKRAAISSRIAMFALSLLILAAATVFIGEPAAQAAQASMSWAAPTTNTDGTPATNLAGYKVHIGSAPGSYQQHIDVGNITSYSATNLTDGSTYYFAVTAYNTSGLESAYSPVVSKTFPVATYQITATATSGGTITAVNNTNANVATNGTTSITNVTVGAGASQTFSIAAAAGYSTANVTVDGASVGAVSSYTFSNVTASHTISATFAVNSFTITATAGSGGSISPAGTTTVNSGTSQTFAITPLSGYQISAVTVDGVSAGTVSSYTFSNVTANHTISATFASTATSTPPTSTSSVITGSTTWQNQSFASQSGVFTANFDMVASANNIDTVTMLSGVAAKTFTDGAAIVRFDPNGNITAMNYSAYSGAIAVPYVAGKSYHIRMVVNVSSHTYDVYVTPAGGNEVRLAAGYAFRSSQATVSALSNLGVYGGIGSQKVSNFSVTPSKTITGSTTWQNLAFPSQTGVFTAYFDMIPAANNIDTVTMLTGVTASAFTDGAAIIRFDPNGNITAMKSGSYTADVAVPYQAGQSYHLRLVVNVPSHIYDVYATAPGGSEVRLATGYPFRSSQATVPALKNLGVYSGLGSHKVMNFSVAP